MTVNDKICGFEVERIRPLSELGGELVEMTHMKTGLKLAWIKRNEENKTFGIAFQTLPFDDTGVFHILEHSVLCGSQKYPVKEPFVELLKTSMNTFLNALTFPDKTFYPISSRNDKDFTNLMRVYLDAVFCPLIYSKPEIFYQEGWHYEIDDKDTVSYKGVVFNEMKGVFASADELEEVALNRALYPDSPYRYVSGGDPVSIPDLTYEQFIESHKKYYSPSNAYVFLDGDVDIESTLEIINNEYLSDCEKQERLAPPVMQKAVDGGVTEVEYEIGEDEELDGRTRISWGRMIGSFDEREKLIAMQVLTDVLCGSNQSLLSKAVLSEGLAEDVSMQLYDGIAQPWLKINAINVKDENKEQIEDFIFTQLKQLADNGIDHSQLEASMANLEFQLRERDYGSFPQGLALGFNIFETWLYGGDPISNLEVGDVFAALKDKMMNGYFEQLINDVILCNSHKAKAVLIPSHTAGDKRREKENERIQNRVSAWSSDEKADVMAKQKSLDEWQNSEDTEEGLAALPQLELSDLSDEPEQLPTEAVETDGIVTLYHDLDCSGIANFSLYFDAEDLSENDICILSFLTDLLGKMNTAKHNEVELDEKTRLLFGALNFYVSSLNRKKDNSRCDIKLAVSFGTLEKNIDTALEFVLEILTLTQFDNETIALDLIRQLKTKYFQTIVMGGASVGMGRIAAQNSTAGVVNEYAGGFEYYKWLSAQEKNFDWNTLKTQLEALLGRLICKNRLTISLTGADKNALSKAVQILSSTLVKKDERKNMENTIKPWGKRREGIIIPADVSFACMGGAMADFDSYDGSMAVASRIISYVYLWNKIRVQGGAYGTGFNINQNGVLFCYSYRDPNAAGSLDTYKGISDFLDDFCNNTKDLDGYIIGTVAGATPLMLPKAKGRRADENYRCGITDEDRKNILLEMLDASAEKIKKLSAKLELTFSDSGICVIGSKDQISNCSLDTIESL